MSKVISNDGKKNGSQTVSVKNTRRRRNRRSRRKQTIPAAFVVSNRKQSTFEIISQSVDKIRIRGRDLVIPTPSELVSGPVPNQIFLAVPSNPIYWTGTRISKIASAYQMFRPERFEVRYFPQVAVTNPGNVIYGTLYSDSTADPSSLQQILATSNGGGVCQCYKEFTSTVNCSRKLLQMEMYDIVGNPSAVSNNPFFWVAHYSGATSSSAQAPGWVEVEWSYTLTAGISGPNNQGNSIVKADISQVTQYVQSNPQSLYASDPRLGIIPFGVVLGVLKKLGRPLMKHVGILLLNGARSGTVRYGVGKVLTYVANNILRQNANTSSVVDDDGQIVELDDDTMVVAYESGTIQGTQPTGPTPIVCDTFKDLTISADVTFVPSSGSESTSSWTDPGKTVGKYKHDITVPGSEPHMVLALNYTITETSIGLELSTITPAEGYSGTIYAKLTLAVSYQSGTTTQYTFDKILWIETREVSETTTIPFAVIKQTE